MMSEKFRPFRLGLVVFTLTLGGVNASFAALTSQDYASVQTSKEKQVDAIRREEISTVKTALSLRSAENRHAELYLRLAELYLEAYRADFLLEGRLQEKALTHNGGARLERGRSVDDLRNGIGAAEQILSLNVDHSKLDQVYYFLGYNYGELGDSKKSSQYYKKLAKEFPNSQYASEGVRAVADEAFQSGNYLEAQKLYEQAVKTTKDPAQQARIYHKLAWCYYRQRRSADAVTTIRKSIGIAKSNSGHNLVNIGEEALRDLAVYYAEYGHVDEALDYFRENAEGNEHLVKLYEKLGKEYERTGQLDSAKKVYAALLGLGQQDESSFRVQTKLIDLDLLKEQFSSAYNRLSDIQLPKSTNPETQLAVSNLKKQVRTTAVNNHERYRRISDQDGSKKYLKVADQFYALYLDKFLPVNEGTRAERNEVRMYLAEVKRELGETGQAAELYKKIIQEKDPKFTKEAAQLWVGSLASELKKRAKEGEKPGDAPSELETDFVNASDLMQQAIPDSTESREARLRSAQILAAYPAEKTQAIARAASLAKEAPSSPQGLLAARLWLQLDPSGKTVDALSKSSSLLAQDKKAKGDLSQDLESSKRKLEVSEISSLEQGKNYAAAAAGYEKFAKGAKTDKEAESAYLGALNAYAQAGKSADVLRVMKEWKAKSPNSKLIESTVKSNATQFFIRGLFNDSAELFLAIGRMQKDLSSELTAAALFDGGLNREKAREVYKEALKLAPNDEEKAKIDRLSAYVAADQHDDGAAEKEWQTCFNRNSSLKAECGSMIANYALHASEMKKAKDHFNQIVQIKKGPSSKSNYIAYAQFRLAQIMEKEMKNQPLAFPQDKLLKAFTTRVSELKPVSAAYQKALELGGPWGIAATERLGDLSLALSNEVEQVLKDPAATDQLRETLQPVAQTLKKQAVDRSKAAYELALKEQILSPALLVIQDRLVDDGNLGYQRAQGARLGVKLIGMSPDGGVQGLEGALKSVRDKLLANQDDALSWIDYGNLLWGTKKPGLARVAYERAFALKTRVADAINNLAVVQVSDMGFENWFAANEAVALWKKALREESDNSAALFNLGHFFNYYRLFPLANEYFEQVVKKVDIADLHDGLAVSNLGLGRVTEAKEEFEKAESQGASKKRFVKKFYEASQVGGAQCLSDLNEMNEKTLEGFERISVNRLKLRCQ